MSSKVVQWWAGRDGYAPQCEPLRACLEREQSTPTVLALPPGTRVFAGQPIWQARFECEPDSVLIDQINALIPSQLAPTRRESQTLVQVYREFDSSGQFVRDVFRDVNADPLPGMVLMRPVTAGGRWCMPACGEDDAQRLIDRQKAAFARDDQPYRPVDERGSR